MNHKITNALHYRNKTILIWKAIIILIIAVPNLSGQYISHPPEPWREAYEITLKGFEFSHPMTVVNDDELSIIRERIQYNVEPQKTAFEKLVEEAEEALSFSPYSPQTLEIPGGYVDSDGLKYARKVLWENCHAAYSCALVYAITGETVYANKAIEVLMHWANRDIRFTGDDSGLQLGSWFSPMLYAADLLHGYNDWTGADRNTFKSWWRNNCLE
ncbi:MAG TPA: alginate lyase family protein, partial [Bacteroidales bacterium]|nr:alginate lyase family protein [Bacteroidales bacterium]